MIPLVLGDFMKTVKSFCKKIKLHKQINKPEKIPLYINVSRIFASINLINKLSGTKAKTPIEVITIPLTWLFFKISSMKIIYIFDVKIFC